MKAIETRYLGPTNYKGGRIKADDGDGNTITIGYPHEASDGMDKHWLAAKALCEKMGWAGDMVGGGTKRGYVFVFLANWTVYTQAGNPAKVLSPMRCNKRGAHPEHAWLLVQRDTHKWCYGA